MTQSRLEKRIKHLVEKKEEEIRELEISLWTSKGALDELKMMLDCLDTDFPVDQTVTLPKDILNEAKKG